jgi:molecular chaperone Hsp33
MKESRLYSFINNKEGFTLHFFEGTKLINDLSKLHDIGPNALSYYRKTILTAQQMITFLKPGESLGVYIDSENPYFRFKIEMNFSGSMRTLLLPEEFSDFPQKLTGKARISKIFPSSQPYTSIINMDKDDASEVVNNILKESYQTKSKVITSDSLDQSVMFTKLPRVEIKKVVEDLDDVPLNEYILQKNKFLTSVFKNHIQGIEKIVETFESEGYSYIGSKEVTFNCPCSKERMITNVTTMSNNDLDHVFEETETLEIRCDYCNTLYNISRSDINH